MMKGCYCFICANGLISNAMACPTWQAAAEAQRKLEAERKAEIEKAEGQRRVESPQRVLDNFFPRPRYFGTGVIGVCKCIWPKPID